MKHYLSDKSLETIATQPGKYQMNDNSKLSAKLQVWWNYVAGLMVNKQKTKNNVKNISFTPI